MARRATRADRQDRRARDLSRTLAGPRRPAATARPDGAGQKILIKAAPVGEIATDDFDAAASDLKAGHRTRSAMESEFRR